MKDIIFVTIGFSLAALCLFLPELRGETGMPAEIVNGLVATTCLFGCLLSFYLCFCIVRDRRPQVMASAVVYMVFVLPIFGLAVARYFSTGNAAFLALAVGTLAVLVIEGRSLVSVGATIQLVHPKLKRIFLNEKLSFREVGSDFYFDESEVAVRTSIVGVTVSEIAFSKQLIFPKIKSALPKETAGDMIPLPYLHFRRYFIWGVMLLLLVVLTAAEKPWWEKLRHKPTYLNGLSKGSESAAPPTSRFSPPL